MSSLDGISPISSAAPELRPELRPELDRARLQTYELAEVYSLQEVRMITPIAYRDAGERLEVLDPLLYGPSTRRPEPERHAEAQGARHVDAPQPSPDGWSPAALRPDAPADASTAGGAESVTGKGMAAAAPGGSAVPQPASTAAPAPLPYGADPGRIRQLVEAIVEGHAVVPFAFHSRQAGDLVTVKPAPAGGVPAATRPVSTVYRGP